MFPFVEQPEMVHSKAAVIHKKQRDALFILSQENQSQSAGQRVQADHGTEMNRGACSPTLADTEAIPPRTRHPEPRGDPGLQTPPECHGMREGNRFLLRPEVGSWT